MPSKNDREKLNNGASEAPRRKLVPPHLAHSSWINFEANSALSLRKNLAEELAELKKKDSARRVHKARVALRRWFSVWKVLQEDGWESDKFQKKVTKPLKKLLSHLGNLRDMDVSLELGESLGCPDELLEAWQCERKQLRKELRQYLKKLDVESLLDEIDDYLHERAEKVEKKASKKKARRSAFEHLDEHVCRQEADVRQMSRSANTPEELHRLRLGIKRWRYLLTEFFGLTTLELVEAQTLLGQIHDLDRLTPILSAESSATAALSRLRAQRQDLLKKLEPIRAKLPYGLRPYMTSARTTSAEDLLDLRT